MWISTIYRSVRHQLLAPAYLRFNSLSLDLLFNYTSQIIRGSRGAAMQPDAHAMNSTLEGDHHGGGELRLEGVGWVGKKKK